MNKKMSSLVSAVLLCALLIAPLVTVSAQTDPTEEPTEEADAPSIIGVEWQWQEFQSSDDTIGTTTVPNPANYTLLLNEDGTFNIQADCNVGGGMYTLNGSELSLTVGMLTRAACPPESLSDMYIQNLGFVVTYVVDAGDLFLNLMADAGNMRFSPAPQFIGVEWQWQEFLSGDNAITSVPNPESYTIVFNEDGSYNFRADCNVGSGTYTFEGGQLTLFPGPMTLAACPEESLSDIFLQNLGWVVGAVMADGDLYLSLMEDAGIMRFSPSAQLIGIEWQWQELQSGDGSVTTVPDPENYTLLFNEDGTYNFQADCNVGGGAYTLDGSQLTLLPGPVTLAACPEESLSDVYLQNLFTVATYVLEGGDLFLNLMADAGNMRFSPAP